LTERAGQVGGWAVGSDSGAWPVGVVHNQARVEKVAGHIEGGALEVLYRVCRDDHTELAVGLEAIGGRDVLCVDHWHRVAELAVAYPGDADFERELVAVGFL
jgi:hypothetical protein